MPTTGDDRGSGVVGPEAIERYEVEGVTYEVHPAARLFPRLEGKQFEELFFDIAMNGLREPVVVRGLEIVDGRNRLRAALRAGGTVRFEELGDDVDVYAFVSSANLYRRHLTTSQRVMLLVSRRPSSVQIAPGELHCAVARSVIVSESVPAGRTLTFQARSLPLVLRHTRLMLPPLTRNAALIFFQPAASSSVNARSNVKSAPVCSSGTFEKLAVSGVPASSATVVDGLLLSWTGVVLVRADGPLGPAGAVAGQRDRHRIVAVRVDGDPPAVAPAVDVRGAAHVAVRDRECCHYQPRAAAALAHRHGHQRRDRDRSCRSLSRSFTTNPPYRLNASGSPHSPIPRRECRHRVAQDRPCHKVETSGSGHRAMPPRPI